MFNYLYSEAVMKRGQIGRLRDQRWYILGPLLYSRTNKFAEIWGVRNEAVGCVHSW